MKQGWKLGLTSLKVIRENTSLLVFPVLSAAALITVVLSFLGGTYAVFGLDFEEMAASAFAENELIFYGGLFIFYLINYFIIVFFNVGLVHCAKMVFEDQKPSVREGLNYSGSRIGAIFSWSVLAATVGVLLRMLEERLGWIGQIAVGLVGIAWSIATYFVIPIIAYENVDPVEALKRSGQIMKEKWGEAVGANFSFGLFYILGYLIIIISAVALFFIHPLLAIVSAVISALLLHTIVAAAQTVFLAATYNQMTDRPAGRFDDLPLDSVFYNKK